MISIPLIIFLGCLGGVFCICLLCACRSPKVRRNYTENTESRTQIYLPTPALSIDIQRFNNISSVSITSSDSSCVYLASLTPISSDVSHQSQPYTPSSYVSSSNGSYFIARL
jgi:hypothetical protein